MTLTTLPPVLPLPAYEAPPSTFIPDMQASWESARDAFVALNALLPQIDAAGAAAAAQAIAAIQASLPVQTFGTKVLGFSAQTPPPNVVVSSLPANWAKIGRQVTVTGRFTVSFGPGGGGQPQIPGLPFPVVGQTTVELLLLGGLTLRTGSKLKAIAEGTTLFLYDEGNYNAVSAQLPSVAGGLDCVLEMTYLTAA